MRDLYIKKLYYSISEVSRITDLEQYVLRYWESEFEELKPAKNRAGNRIYTNRDIKLILFIKKLLREERYTIEGAKQVLKSYQADAAEEEVPKLDATPAQKAQPADELHSQLDVEAQHNMLEVKEFLEELLVKLG
jgi:DNA-binding transcriptional MerR regulator